MVDPTSALTAVAQAAPKRQLDQGQQAAALVALLSLLVLGLVVLLLGWLSIRALRAYMRHSSHAARRTALDEFDWARRPLSPDDPMASDDTSQDK